MMPELDRKIVEIAAKAAYECNRMADHWTWEDMKPEKQEQWRDEQRAVDGEGMSGMARSPEV